jgi:phosphoserine phosphatase RsbU/P
MVERDTELIARRHALRVLLIEHDEAFARAVSGMLDQARETVGSVVVAASLKEGITRVAQEAFGVILLEFFLPDGAGLANIPVLKAAAPHVPIIVVGATDEEAIAVEAVHLGAQDYLVKDHLNPSWLRRSIHYTIERHEADRALMAAEQKYHGIFDHLVEGVFQTTPEGHYLMANSALAHIYGYESPEDLMAHVTDIGRRLYVAPGRREEFKRIMDEHDTLTGFESQIFRKDGSIIWIAENCHAIRDAQGRLQHYEGTVEDITQQRMAEERVRNSEALYHSLVETLPQYIFRKDVHSRFTFANQQFCKVLGLPLEEVIGKSDADFFPAELADKYRLDDQRIMATGEPFETVEENRRADGNKRYVQVVKTPLYDTTGHVIGLQGIFWDITAQKVADERIRQVNAELARSREELRLKNEQMEEDLKMAREIQVAMLPQQYPVLPGGAAPAESAFQFTHRYQPSGTVGGDFFSISALSDTEVAVFICDVAGHGVRSALITAMIRALVEELRPLAHDPGQFMTKLNSELFAILKHAGSPVMTTAFYLVANSTTGAMLCANAGHPRPLLLRRSAGRVESFKNPTRQNQPALGLFDKSAYQTFETKLAAHDLVMLFTDGLYEVHSPNDELYTQEKLAATVGQHLAEPAAELFDRLLREDGDYAADHTFEDDVCLVGLEYSGAATPKPG